MRRTVSSSQAIYCSSFQQLHGTPNLLAVSELPSDGGHRNRSWKNHEAIDYLAEAARGSRGKNYSYTHCWVCFAYLFRQQQMIAHLIVEPIIASLSNPNQQKSPLPW
ncbi:unnamed protein product [Ceratitis capitata]|uniref:(Mediterranean fruit fly) hypothetical protein n=1 Tax=Ceratitis capitata TaxID=7213 RepID=A0A811V3S9_CERCA|nr:unnamed protein product [Ceratitis capitata]